MSGLGWISGLGGGSCPCTNVKSICCDIVILWGRESELREVVDLITWLKDAHNGTIGATAVPGSRPRMVRDILDIFQAFVRGVVADLLLPDRPFASLDELDLRAWLLRHGADPEIVAHSTVLRVVYDTLFQYPDGDTKRPSYAAGSALGTIVRLVGTYKGAMLWELQAGMGEAVIAPIYQALLQAGVGFRFFRKVVKLELSADRRRIGTIRMLRQSETVAGEYRPTFELNGLTCWPSEPFWDQLKHGQALKDRGVNFESHWYALPPGVPPEQEEILRLGTDFDTVVLAIAIGAFKRLNSDPGMCDELITQNRRFADWVNNTSIVPSQAIQLWCDQTLDQLGWMSGKPALVSGAQYFDIWADMSQVLHVEPSKENRAPKSLHYLTGTFNTTLHKEPAAHKDVPARAAEEVRRGAIAWLDANSAFIWPRTRTARGFDWNVLSDPSGGAGQARFDAQFWRANIDPTECCVASAASTTKYRLGPDESGFDNLVLAGEATRHGLNTTCIEGAVMSGLAASRAICGEPATIVGYDFLQRRPSQGPEDGSSAVPPCGPVGASCPSVASAAGTLLGWLDILAGCAGRATAKATAASGSGPTGAGLPPFIPWIGHGAVSLAPRGVFTGAKAHLFGVKASATAMQALVGALLNRASGGTVRYQSFADLSLVTFMNIAKCTSDTDAIGWLPGRECALWCPLWETLSDGSRDPRFVLWAPYIFIDYDIGMATGREIWGWPKASARIGVPDDRPQHPAAFTCHTTIFKTLAPDTLGRHAVLFSVTSSAPLAPAASQWSNGLDAARSITELLAGVAARVQHSLALKPAIPAVVNRQVRDIALTNSARVQEIVDSPIVITNFEGGGLLDGEFSLQVTTCESHRIAQDLFGMTPTRAIMDFPVQWAAWAAFDFEAPAGRRIAGTA